MTRRILARHNAHRAAWLTLSDREDGLDGLFDLLAVEPASGQLPDCSDLIGSYTSVAAARRAVLARLRSPRRDTLDRVLLSVEVVRAWEAHAASIAAQLTAAGISPADIPDEQAEQQADGSLLIYVEVPGQPRIGMRVPAGAWRWR